MHRNWRHWNCRRRRQLHSFLGDVDNKLLRALQRKLQTLPMWCSESRHLESVGWILCLQIQRVVESGSLRRCWNSFTGRRVPGGRCLHLGDCGRGQLQLHYRFPHSRSDWWYRFPYSFEFFSRCIVVALSVECRICALTKFFRVILSFGFDTIFMCTFADQQTASHLYVWSRFW